MNAVRVEGAAHRLDQLRAFEKHFTHFGIHHQVDIALAVAQLDVMSMACATSPANFPIGNGKIFAEERDLLDMNAEFAGAGAEQVSADSDVVAEIEQLVKIESFFADGIFLHINLKPVAALLKVGKSGLTHEANGHEASGDAHVHASLVEFLRSFGCELRKNLFNRMRKVVLAAVRRLPESLNLFQLFAPQFVNLVVECQGCPLGSCGKVF